MFILRGDDTTPTEQKDTLNISSALVFVGEKKTAPSLKELYYKAIMSIPHYLAMPPRNGLTFGKQAFEDWANSLIDGTLDDIPVSDIDVWDCHGTYLCMAGTNCYVGNCLFDEIAEYRCPELASLTEMAIMEKIKPIFAREDKIFHELMDMGAGFNISREKLKDKEAMKPVADKIREFSKCCDEILAVFAELQ